MKIMKLVYNSSLVIIMNMGILKNTILEHKIRFLKNNQTTRLE